ncbi:hypothetical protein WDZ92_15640 [Nostoc sp. NIES-2111]
MSLSTFSRTHLPYCLRRAKDGTYITLNREYCYPGTNIGELGLDKTFEDAQFRYDLPEKILRELDARPADQFTADIIFLYQDDTQPANSTAKARRYFERLELLLSLKPVNGQQRVEAHTYLARREAIQTT